MVLKGLQSGRKELAEGARIVLERAKTNKLVDWNVRNIDRQTDNQTKTRTHRLCYIAI